MWPRSACEERQRERDHDEEHAWLSCIYGTIFCTRRKRLKRIHAFQRSVTRPTLTQYTLAVALNSAARKQTECVWHHLVPLFGLARVRAAPTLLHTSLSA